MSHNEVDMGKRIANGSKPYHKQQTPVEEAAPTPWTKNVTPRPGNQTRLMDALTSYELVLALGPAGTGKTFLSITAAVQAMDNGDVERIILTRPNVEAGESLGFLPGDLQEKMDPYLRPLYDALVDRMGGKRMRTLMSSGLIEIAPVGYMRGRTLSRAFILIDEAQNCSYAQLKMLITRLGPGSVMVLTGDPDQSDLPLDQSGLADVAHRLSGMDDVAIVELEEEDIVRHPLIAKVLKRL